MSGWFEALGAGLVTGICIMILYQVGTWILNKRRR